MKMHLRIYLSSSWKNRERVRALANKLRDLGHDIYDFTDPACRKGGEEIPPEKFPDQFDPEKHNYREYLNSVPHWRQAVQGNFDYLNHADAVVLMLPCGNDAHADAYYARGRGSLLVVTGQPRAGERTPTHLQADAILDQDDDVLAWFTEMARKSIAQQG